MEPLDRKLLRDIWRLRGQVLAIALVIGSGVAVLVMALATHASIKETTRAYYERYRFADVFAEVTRAPEFLVRRISEIPGVMAAESRISAFGNTEIADFAEPVVSRLISIPEGTQPRLNRLALQRGRFVEKGRRDEVVVNEPFAESHGLNLGDNIWVVMNGHKRKLTVVGIALSPEFVYSIGPGALMPDDRRFGILWMGREALAGAYDLDGAFNSISLALLRDTSRAEVIDRLDLLLESYGGTGAYERKDQISNWFLMNELDQMETMARILPTIFLAVAAFLANMVLARLVAVERSEIGLMKAFGYSNGEVAWHYAKLVIAMALAGILLGWLLGALLASYNTRIFAEFYRFPLLYFRPDPAAFAIAAVVSLAAALVGSLGAVLRAARLPPAEAMRPPEPPNYRRDGLSQSRIGLFLDQPTRIFLRQIYRWPLRSLMTSSGIALSVAVMLMALQWIDSIDRIVTVNFYQAQRQDATLALEEARAPGLLFDAANLPGVMATEPLRAVPADLSTGVKSYRGSLVGLPREPKLQLVYDVGGRSLSLPSHGLLISTKLAEKLDLQVGDRLQVKFLTGKRREVSVPVVELFETYIGMPAYMEIDALNRLLLEPPAIDQINIKVDAAAMPALFSELKDLPSVSAVSLRQAQIDTFHDTMGETLMIFVTFYIGFACALAYGVIYNSTRIALSERGRELATLRVLGFSRWEISYILLGEVLLLVFIGLPLGCLVGYGLSWLMTLNFETELFRVPFYIEAFSFGVAMLVALAATLFSAALVRRRLDRLDLIAVLKTRE